MRGFTKRYFPKSRRRSVNKALNRARKRIRGGRRRRAYGIR